MGKLSRGSILSNRNHISAARNIYIIGITVIMGGIGFIAISNSFPEYELISEILRDTGIALIIAGSVGLALEYHLQTYTLKDIDNSITDTVNVVKSAIHREEVLLGECKNNGLIRIYEPHSKTGPNSEFDRDILDQLEREEREIKIYAISARHFFHHERKYYAKLREASKRGVKIKALLTDPFSRSAKKRACFEEGIDPDKSYFQSKLCTEIILSSLTINRGEVAGMERDNIRFHNGEPAYFLFICSDFIIIEPYHFGKIETDEIGILGGHVPAFKFKGDSDAYLRLNAHFENCFNHSSRPLSKIVSEYDAIAAKLSDEMELS
jgi:hypothetical protein